MEQNVSTKQNVIKEAHSNAKILEEQNVHPIVLNKMFK